MGIFLLVFFSTLLSQIALFEYSSLWFCLGLYFISLEWFHKALANYVTTEMFFDESLWLTSCSKHGYCQDSGKKTGALSGQVFKSSKHRDTSGVGQLFSVLYSFQIYILILMPSFNPLSSQSAVLVPFAAWFAILTTRKNLAL